MRKAVKLTAAVLAAVFLWLIATLPPRPAPASGTVDETIRRRTVAGAFHVHSTRSDGAGDREAIARAAARAGLRFVVITDHGNGTRQPDAPAYVHGVLCIDAVEISTNGGHYIALDMPAAPYPLGGESAAVVEDVARLGGFGIAAHPDSVKAELRWTDWGAPVGGLEWLNLDSEWRDETRRRLVRVAFDYVFRKAPALASMLDRPSSTLDRWDSIAAIRTFVGLAGHDAHGGLTERDEDGRRRGFPGLPSYEASFRTFAVRAVLDAEPSRAADHDSRMLLDAFRAGRIYTAIDASAGPAWVDYHATHAGAPVSMGQSLPFAEGTTLVFRSTLPQGSRAVLLRNGTEVADATSGDLRASAREPGAYRVEVSLPSSPGSPPVPWIVTNPIYLTRSVSDPDQPSLTFTSVLRLTDPAALEKDPGSIASVSSDGGGWIVKYRLRPGERASQYVAIAVPLPQARPAFDAVVFDARSSAPMRVSVQLRFDDLGGARWAHSVYVSPERRRITVPLERLVSVDRVFQQPRFVSASSLLFVVDLTNAQPGGEGQFEVSDLALAAAVPTGR